MLDVRAPSATPVLLAAACATLAVGCSAIEDSFNADPIAPPATAAFMTLGVPSASLISSPDDGGVFIQGETIVFTAEVMHPGLGLASGTIVWTSSRDGWIGAGSRFTRGDLSAGEHVITMSVPGALGTSARDTRTIHIVSNAPPVPIIVGPADGASFTGGDNVTFMGRATDAEDGVIDGGSLTWSSDLDGVIGTGVSVSTSTLRQGTHTVTLSAIDSKGAAAGTTITIVIGAPRANLNPQAFITEPLYGAAFAAGASIRFNGSGRDPEEGVLAGGALVWRSDRDGDIGTGNSFTRVLSPGDHRITLTATDAHGATHTESRVITVAGSNQPPTASIVAPAAGSSFTQGTAVTFSGAGSDPETGAMSGSALRWSSNRSGFLGNGASITTTNLAVGAHVVTLVVRDPMGATATATRNITITPRTAGTGAGTGTGTGTGTGSGTNTGTGGGSAGPTESNRTPFGLMSSPAHRSVHPQGTTIVFTGSANDPEDGPLTGSALTWRSNRDGLLGTGTSLTRNNLSVGEHLVSFTARDSKGITYTHYRVIEVSSAQTSGGLIASITVSIGASTIPVGGTTLATAVLRNALGILLNGRPVTWQSSNPAVASVNPSTGAVTGVGAGQAYITATGDGMLGRALITVTGTVATGGGSQQTGLTTLLDESLASAAWTRMGTAALRSEPTAPQGGSVIRVTYPAGFAGGSAPGAFYPPGFQFKARTAVYETWMRVSDNFQGHPTAINKLIHFYICGSNRLFLQGYGDGLSATLSYQGIAQPYQNGSTAGHLTPNRGSAQFKRGQWHHVQIELEANTPGKADGSVTMWFDGAEVTRYTGITFCAPGDGPPVWEGMNHSPTWGGAGGTVTSPFFVEWAHVRLGRK